MDGVSGELLVPSVESIMEDVGTGLNIGVEPSRPHRWEC